MPACSVMPGSFGLLCAAAMALAASALCAQRTTLRPARAATPASAVPHAPAPTTAIKLKEVIGETQRAQPSQSLVLKGGRLRRGSAKRSNSFAKLRALAELADLPLSGRDERGI